MWVVVGRGGRDHRLLGDVRARVGRRASVPCSTSCASGSGFGPALGDADRVRDRQPDDVRRGDRRRRDRAPAPVGPAVPGPDPARGRSRSSSAAGSLPFEWIERRLRLRRSLPARLRRRGDQAPARTGDASRTASSRASHAGGSLSVYLYFVVGLLGAAMTPYEVYFYSSGAVEDRWGPKELGLNKATAIIGYVLGGFLSFALMIVAASVPAARDLAGVSRHARARRRARTRAGRACSSRWSASSSPSAEPRSRRRFSGAYNLAQFFGWEWGKSERPARARPLHALVARDASRSRSAIVMTGVRPGQADRVLGDLLGRRASADLPADPARRQRPRLHGRERATGGSRTCSASLYLGVILVIAVAAIPLMLLTNGGQG